MNLHKETNLVIVKTKDNIFKRIWDDLNKPYTTESYSQFCSNYVETKTSFLIELCKMVGIISVIVFLYVNFRK